MSESKKHCSAASDLAPIARELAAVEAEQQRCGDYLREHGMPTGRDLGAALGAQDWLLEEALVRDKK
jgi:hypothetical protein